MDNNIPAPGSGLYTGPSESNFKPNPTPEPGSGIFTSPSPDSFKPIESSENSTNNPEPSYDQYGQILNKNSEERVLPWVPSQGPSQTPIDMSKFGEELSHSNDEVLRNWDGNMSDTPSVAVAKETQEKKKKDPVKREKKESDSNKELKIKIEMLTQDINNLNQIVTQNNIQINNLLNIIQNNNTTIINPPPKPEETEPINPPTPPVVPPTPPVVPPTPPVIPPTPPVEPPRPPEIIDPEKAKKEKRLKTVAFIAGAVVGTAGGIMGGAATGVIGAMTCTALGYVSKGVEKWALSSESKLQGRINQLPDGPEKDKLTKRKAGWEKVRGSLVYIRPFLLGAGIGFTASGLAMGVVNGGHGLAWNTGENVVSPLGNGGPEQNPGSKPEITQAPEVTSSSGSLSPESLPANNYDLFADNQVNLDGSAMDGWRLADVPEYYKGMPLEQIPANQFANSGSKAFQIFIRDLQANGISNDALNAIPRPVLHQVLADGAYNQSNILSQLQELGYLKP